MKYIRDQYGRVVQQRDMYPLLGLRKEDHLPDAGLPPRDIQGVTVYVKPKTEKGRKHRVIAICPECGKHVPFGRLTQHGKVHR